MEEIQLPAPRVAAIHDLSGFGRCSLTIIMPVLSAMGVQCCPLPTAWLSTHTGFAGNTFLDLTDQLTPAAAHWQSLGVAFDAVYTGFMGSRAQLDQTAALLPGLGGGRALVVVDPVMGDDGRPYRTYTPAMCRAMASLAELADVLVPNATEAALLLGEPYDSLSTENACRACVARLSRNGRRSVVLTGVSFDQDTVGAFCFDRVSGQMSAAAAPRVPGAFHGTGDLFAAVLTGALTLGMPLDKAAQWAASFTSRCAERTCQLQLPRREGLDFEPLLYQLSSRARAWCRRHPLVKGVSL